jgi:hypothetical protein
MVCVEPWFNFFNLKMSTKNVNYQLLIGSINRLVSEFIMINELLTKRGKMWRNVNF